MPTGVPVERCHAKIGLTVLGPLLSISGMKMPYIAFSLFLLLAMSPAFAAGQERSLEDQLKDLQSGDASAKTATLYSLGSKKEEKATGAIIPMLLPEQGESVNRAAAVALGQIANNQATDAILVFVRTTASETNRYTGLLALANLADKKKKDTVLEICKWVSENTKDDLTKDLALRVQKIYDK